MIANILYVQLPAFIRTTGKILVALPTKYTSTVEMLPLNSDTVVPSCFVPMSFPRKLKHYAVGQMDHDRILICGGEDETGAARKECYSFDLEANMWVHAGDMPQEGMLMGFTVAYNFGLVLAGGLGR